MRIMDLEKAYDRIDREPMLDVLHSEEKWLNAFKSIFNEINAGVSGK